MKKYLYFSLMLFGAHPLAAGEIKLSGATSVAVKFTDEKIKEINKACSITLNVAKTGSGKGLKLLTDGKVDGAMIAGSIDIVKAECTKELACNFETHKYAYKKVGETEYMAIANPANTMSTISWDQIKKIYTGGVKNWSEVGPYTAPMVAVRGHMGEANVFETKAQILSNADFGKDVREMNISTQVPVVVGQSPGGFGIVGKSHLAENESKVKVLTMDKPLKVPLGLSYREEKAKDIECIAQQLEKK